MTSEDLGQRFLDGFLSRRDGNTRYAYSRDLSDFARHARLPLAAAIAQLLSEGPVAARRQVLDYAVELRRLGRARTTIDRRLSTLRAVSREALDAGLVSWLLELPTDADITAAVEERANAASYMFPRHPSEIDRLDVQHYALREALSANHVAPIDSPRWILDAGCGTGQWGFEMCSQFPDARVVGLDLVRGKPLHPPGYHFVRGNLLHGLPFLDDAFDFVHQRFLVVGVPLDQWPPVVAELGRVTRPGGWLELVEPRLGLERVGPATDRIQKMMLEMAAALRLDTGRAVADSLPAFLVGIGLAGVTRRDVDLPVGEWGGRVGAMMATDMRAAFTRSCEGLHAMGRISLEEGLELVRRAMAEFEQQRTTGTCTIALGRKPA